MRRFRYLLEIAVLALLAIGLVVLASAGTTVAERFKVGTYHFVSHQAVWLAIGLVGLVAAAFFDYTAWRRKPWLTVALYALIVLAMVAVFGFHAVNGSRRWIILGPIRIQPGEFAKLMCVIATAVWLDRADWRVRLLWKGVAPICLIAGVLVGLAVLEPDFGTAFVIAVTFGAMLFVGGVKIWHILLMIGGGALVVLTVLLKNANRMRRIISWLPEQWRDQVVQLLPISAPLSSADAHEAQHQLNQALVAIQRGGLRGVGFNLSMQKQSYLPENHTDFIFAIGAEEWGIGFSMLVLALFTTIFACGLFIAMNAKDRLGKLLAFGVSFLLFFQALFNMAVVSGLMPTKGIALPFMSYGGTNLLSALIAAGILIGVSRQTGLQNLREKSKINAVFSN